MHEIDRIGRGSEEAQGTWPGEFSRSFELDQSKKDRDGGRTEIKPANQRHRLDIAEEDQSEQEHGETSQKHEPGHGCLPAAQPKGGADAEEELDIEGIEKDRPRIGKLAAELR